MKSAISARPLQLVRCDADGKLAVGEEAVDVLRNVRGPVAVVAVCGRARQGKSFILNQIAASCETTSGASSKEKNGGGFEVAPTHRPCTKVRTHPVSRGPAIVRVLPRVGNLFTPERRYMEI